MRYACLVLMYCISWKQTRGAADEFILSLANQEQRILLTQDKDFGELVFRLKNAHFGVVLIRLNGYSSSEKADTIVRLFIKYRDELVKSFTVIQPNAIRIRK
jgi:predicted nuclease of predicted toxin-antitoxin system